MIFKAILTINVVLLVTSTVQGRVGFGPGDQEWGYTTVRPGAHMFWWLYYTTANVSSSYEKPLIIWLQGGPGQASTGYGNFWEFGPLDENFQPRNHTWVKHYNILFIDNPVGVGFSYVDSSDKLATSIEQIGADLLVCIKNVYEKFPEFSDTPAYIIGESYGGKYTVQLAKDWSEAQKNNEIKSNLKGIALGNSYISPVHIIPARGEFLYQMGLLDTHTLDLLKVVYKNIEEAVETESWSKALELTLTAQQLVFNSSINIKNNNVLVKMPAVLNLASSSEYDCQNKFDRLMNHRIKEALGLNSTFKLMNYEVQKALYNDHVRAVTDQIEHLLNVTDVKVYVYSGQLDALCPTSGAVRWLDSLKWKNSSEWFYSKRTPLAVNNIIEGYVKQYGNLKVFWVNRAGHSAPVDNPKAVLTILEDLTDADNSTI